MFSKSNLLSTLITAIWAFAGGYLLWGILGEPLLADHLGNATGVMKDPPDFIHLAIGCIIMAFAFSTIYSKWAKGIHSISQGAQFGLWVGIMVGFGSGIIDFATSNLLEFQGALVNGLIYVVFNVIMGALAAVVYKATSK